MSGLIEDIWIVVFASIFDLLGCIVVVEVHEENNDLIQINSRNISKVDMAEKASALHHFSHSHY